jgi:flagellar motility protein MotE (MotC chaperone)
MFKFLAKIRIIPVVIFSAVLMLSFKVGDILSGIDTGLDAFSVSQVKAQAPNLAAPAGASKLQIKNAKTSNLSKPKNIENDPQDDPTLFTENEIKVLQQLVSRRKVIEARLDELTLREGLLGAAEKRIDKKIQEMKSLELAIKKLIKSHDLQENLKIKSLVKIYESMKPKDAARIFGELDINTLLKVAERMKEKKLAPIMAKMNPDRAKEMTVALSKLRNLPIPGT